MPIFRDELEEQVWIENEAMEGLVYNRIIEPLEEKPEVAFSTDEIIDLIQLPPIFQGPEGMGRLEGIANPVIPRDFFKSLDDYQKYLKKELITSALFKLRIYERIGARMIKHTIYYYAIR